MIIIRVAALVFATLMAAGCSATAPPGPAPASTPATAGAVTSDHRALVERFVTAINSGDQAAVRDTFAEEARFDSVGRLYEGRDEIMDRFLVPEVIRAAGTYKLLSLTAGDGGRIVAEYDFTTGGGGREHFTYACTLREDRFADCLGRYV
ncbi:nuclear transport factor 2 family protein [Nonomuraea sp. NPDC049141]|uniref:nuclear transport factor 2 family protein n=1 Tax=Nonomuraea sp. NPDC049141 TaxID=3155500 RepID=UPI00340E97B6